MNHLVRAAHRPAWLYTQQHLSRGCPAALRLWSWLTCSCCFVARVEAALLPWHRCRWNHSSAPLLDSPAPSQRRPRLWASAEVSSASTKAGAGGLCRQFDTQMGLSTRPDLLTDGTLLLQRTDTPPLAGTAGKGTPGMTGAEHQRREAAETPGLRAVDRAPSRLRSLQSTPAWQARGLRLGERCTTSRAGFTRTREEQQRCSRTWEKTEPRPPSRPTAI